jgi:acyl carrier protein
MSAQTEVVMLELFRQAVKKPLVGQVRPEARLQADLDLDSLGVLSTVLAAEQKLGISLFPLPPDVGEIRTVGDVIALVAARVKAG